MQVVVQFSEAQRITCGFSKMKVVGGSKCNLGEFQNSNDAKLEMILVVFSRKRLN